MREAGIGRVLVASLHQGITDLIPTRLTFYEEWLNAEGLRDGTIGLAPFYAVLSFLRQEDGDAYGRVMTRAGTYAAEWTVEAMTPFQRSVLKSAPIWLRRRLLVSRARRLVRESYRGSRASSRLRRGTARFDLQSSIFCSVREPVSHPLCLFYAAAFERLLTLFDLPTHASVVECRGTGEARCIVAMELSDQPAVSAVGVAVP